VMSEDTFGLDGLARSRPGVVEGVRRSLRRLAATGDPRVRSLAEQVLSGRLSVRDIPADAVPDDGLRRALVSTSAALDAMSEQERERLVVRGRAEIEELARDAGPEAGARRRGGGVRG
jgi:hypothetical protein